jgi:hypothetical protein
MDLVLRGPEDDLVKVKIFCHGNINKITNLLCLTDTLYLVYVLKHFGMVGIKKNQYCGHEESSRWFILGNVCYSFFSESSAFPSAVKR